MRDKDFQKWIMQTSKTWEDIRNLISQTGIGQVDHDHKKLAKYILELNTILASSNDYYTYKNTQRIENLLNQFVLYAEAHFKREEEIIEELKIDFLERQKREHRYIIQNIKELLGSYDKGKISSAFQLKIDLLEWVVNHINSTDKETFVFRNTVNAIVEIKDINKIKEYLRRIHIPFIDKEHEGLTNRIFEITQAKKDIAVKKLRILEKDIDSHFLHEEELMRKYNNPKEESHIGLHKNFRTLIETAKIAAETQEVDEEECAEINKQLLKWWLIHINIEDYKTFVETPWLETFYEETKSAEETFWLISKTGIDIIDSDHRKFIEIVFELNTKIEDLMIKKEYSKIKELVGKLREYASQHFNNEEKIMNNLDKEITSDHIKEHKQILFKIDTWQESETNQILNLSSNLKKTLLEWWISHTNGTDYYSFGADYEKE
ncbi:MAG: hemerythrin family protein [Spirochaetales bacterium]|nr:hemerythrin family protein [Spirochaetales bacterium]